MKMGTATDLSISPGAVLRALQALPGNYLVLHPDSPKFTIADANPAFAKLVSKAPAELIGRGLFEVLPAGVTETSALLSKELSLLLSKKEPVKTDVLNYAGHAGTRCWTHAGAPVLDAENNIVYILLTTEETAVVTSEKEFGETEAVRLLATLPGMVAYADKDLRIRYANEAYARWHGKTAAELLGKTIEEIVGPADFMRVKSKIAQVMAGEKQSLVVERRNEQGSRFLDAVYTPDLDEQGNVKGCSVFFTDITDKIATEKALKRKTFELQDYVDNANVGLHWVNAQGIIIWANKSELDMLGYTAEEYIGRPVSDFHADKDTIDDILVRLGKNENLQQYEATLRCKDGSLRHVLINSSVFWEDGRFMHTRCITIDITEKKHTERSYQQLITSLPAAVYTCDEQGRITLFNDTAVRLWGRTPELGKDLWCGSWKIYKPDGSPLPLDSCPMAIALHEGRIVAGAEIIIERPDGERRYVLPHPRPLFDTAGKITGALNLLVDITELKSAEKAISESEARFRLLTDIMPQQIWAGDAEGYLTYFSKSVFSYSGLSEEELQEYGWQRVVHPDDRDENMKRWQKSIQTGEDFIFEHRFRRYDGEYRWQLSRAIAHKDTSGKVLMWVGTSTDIHEHKESEKAIRENIERIHFLADSMPQKIWTASPDGEVTYMNLRWSNYSGISFDEFKKTGWALIIHPEDLEASRKKWLHSVASGQDFETEHRFRNRHGGYRWHLSRSIPQRDKDGNIIMWVGTDTDIDDKKKAEEELIMANKIAEYSLVKRDKALHQLLETKKELESLMKVKEQFLSNMSHEIRTPMNAIVGFTDLALKTELSREQKQYIDAIKTSGENLLVIINDILDFSKLRAGGITFEKINFRLSPLMSTLVDLMLPKSTQKGIKLSIVLDKNIPEHLVGDPTRLNQVLLNLVGNAIKFTEKGAVKTKVSLVSENEKEVTLKFSVSDTGIGIPEQKIASVFEPFTQATSDTTRKYGGSGLGLSIVRQFVEQQGGSVSVKSEVGSGSTFSFTLSFGKNPGPDLMPAQLPAGEETERSVYEGLNVLLVEDNDLNQILAVKVLGGWKWNVEVAENGIVALEKLKHMSFDIILMDIQLPEMDGYEATRHIRTKFRGRKKNIPIMAMTAHAMPSEQQKCREAGMDDYISKPFSPKVLYSKIIAIMEKVVHEGSQARDQVVQKK